MTNAHIAPRFGTDQSYVYPRRFPPLTHRKTIFDFHGRMYIFLVFELLYNMVGCFVFLGGFKGAGNVG